MPERTFRTLRPTALLAATFVVLTATLAAGGSFAARAGHAQEQPPEPAAEQPAEQPPPAEPPGPRFRAEPAELPPAGYDPLGSDDPDSPYFLQIRVAAYGVGVESLRLSRFRQSYVPGSDPVELQAARPVPGATVTFPLAPLGVIDVQIDGQRVNLTGMREQSGGGLVPEPVWEQVAPGHFRARIVDEDGSPVARIERRYVLEEGSYSILIRQSITNLTDRQLAIRWRQFGPSVLHREATTDPQGRVRKPYGGDRRRVRFGYLLSPQQDPGQTHVQADDFLWDIRGRKVLGRQENGRYPPYHTLWPNSRSSARAYSPVWVGATNRYFGVAVHPAYPLTDKVLSVGQNVQRVLIRSEPIEFLLALAGGPRRVDPGQSVDLSVGVYAGPLNRATIEADPNSDRLLAAGIDRAIVFSFGGPCAVCTFPWLTAALYWILSTLHDLILFDWTLAIIVLVVIVRTLLHPVTRWSQIRIQRFGKQMQDLAPKIQKLQEKYGNDPKKKQEEMTRLWREEGVSPTGFLGCLPMFLQMPVWIALYAMLFFAIDLRQQPAFFGIFQTLTNGRWSFLADLSRADAAIPLGFQFDVPLLGEYMGTIYSLNILPLLLGVVFFVHQKYLTPPTTMTMTPEQQQQQKIMKVMMVVMFPLIMYNAPSGLAFYFIANSALGIAEMKLIRRHIDKHKLLEVPKRGSGGGFFSRLQQAAEQRRQVLEQAKKLQERGGTPKPKHGRPGMPPIPGQQEQELPPGVVPPTPPPKRERYKKRR